MVKSLLKETNLSINKEYSTIQTIGVSKKKILFRNNALIWLKVPVKTFIMLQKIYISKLLFLSFEGSSDIGLMTVEKSAVITRIHFLNRNSYVKLYLYVTVMQFLQYFWSNKCHLGEH